MGEPQTPSGTLSGEGMVVAGIFTLVACFGLFLASAWLASWLWPGFAAVDDAFSGFTVTAVSVAALWRVTSGRAADTFREFLGFAVQPAMDEVAQTREVMSRFTRAWLAQKLHEWNLLAAVVATLALYSLGSQLLRVGFGVFAPDPIFEPKGMWPAWAEHADSYGFGIGVMIAFICLGMFAIALDRQHPEDS